jgi:D-alanine-D-alanine ligase
MNRNIILLFGGDSDERLVSIASAQAMAQALGSATLWFWHKDGPIFDVSYHQLIDHKNPFINEFNPNKNLIFKNINNAIISKSGDEYIFVLGLHGGSGENGYVQGLLEQAKIPFTGSCAKASCIAFDKVATKECLKGYQIKMAPHVLLSTSNYETSYEELGNFFDLQGPMIIKPVCGGSSLRCFFIFSRENIGSVLDKIMQFSPQAFFAEKLIHGREITVGVIEDNNGPMGLPCTEIMLEKNRQFDYQGKYLGLGTKEITPANLKDNLAREAQRMAVASHAALSLDGYSRTDMILAKDGFYFLETNTLPGLTMQSLVPQQLAAAGITMREFLNAQIELALNRKF